MSEDEIPSDVDLSDPYFAEELGKTGELRQVTSGINVPSSNVKIAVAFFPRVEGNCEVTAVTEKCKNWRRN